MGGAMLRDFAIVATAFEVDAIEARRAGLLGVVSLGLGTILPFIVGGLVAAAFGYTDAISITTIGAGAITYIVGPGTGAALGADSAGGGVFPPPGGGQGGVGVVWAPPFAPFPCRHKPPP